MKRIVVGLLAVCLLGSLTVLAEAPKKEVALQEITATGKLAKLGTSFTVKEADGTVVKVMVPKAVKEGEAAVADLEKYVGKDVKVVGMGTTKTIKDKTTKTIKTVTSIEEAVAPAAVAPAAAAPAAAAPAAEAPAAK